MEKLNVSELRALVNLTGNHNFTVVLDYYKRQLEHQSRNNDVEIDEVNLRMGQGRNQVYNHIINSARDAHSKMVKLQK